MAEFIKISADVLILLLLELTFWGVIGNLITEPKEVLILLLLELTFWAKEFSGNKYFVYGLNPSFTGTYLLRIC